MLRDSFGRSVDYLRLSVTDRCNLRCVYCMPPEGIPLKPMEEILTYGELLRVARVAVSLGIRKIRITGGEPLVRRGIVDFVRELSRVPGIEDLCLTTNGVALADLAAPLAAAGLRRVNVSLDTVRRERYAEVTRRDLLPAVLAGIDAAIAAGLLPVKINAVLLAGVHPGEVDDFLALAREMPVEVRFIERMPVGCLPAEGYVSAEGIRRRILSLPGARERNGAGSTPAVTYDVPGFRGTLGIISPVSRKFCASCNRLRLTADGRLRSCLFASETLDMRAALRGDGGDRAVADLFCRGVGEKHEGHDLGGGGDPGAAAEPMSRVGG